MSKILVRLSVLSLLLGVLYSNFQASRKASLNAACNSRLAHYGQETQKSLAQAKARMNVKNFPTETLESLKFCPADGSCYGKVIQNGQVKVWCKSMCHLAEGYPQYSSSKGLIMYP